MTVKGDCCRSGIAPLTLRLWVEATRPKPDILLTDAERTELRRLRKENRELNMEREILKKSGLGSRGRRNASAQ
jgi:transposase